METVNIENVDDVEQQGGYSRRSNREEEKDDEEVRSQKIQRGLKKQRSRRKARDRDDFRTSFANPQTNLMLANDDDPNFWGVSNRWFSDAGEFVGELTGMATRRASVDTDKGSSYSDYNLPKVEGHHEIVHAIDVMDDDNRGVVFARGMSGVTAMQAGASSGRHSRDLADGVAQEVIHRDDLVVLIG